jgi:hypothetical protein
MSGLFVARKFQQSENNSSASLTVNFRLLKFLPSQRHTAPNRSLTTSATNQQTALPLPATGDQTGERGKPANDRENPGRLIKGEMPEPRE